MGSSSWHRVGPHAEPLPVPVFPWLPSAFAGMGPLLRACCHFPKKGSSQVTGVTWAAQLQHPQMPIRCPQGGMILSLAWALRCGLLRPPRASSFASPHLVCRCSEEDASPARDTHRGSWEPLKQKLQGLAKPVPRHSLSAPPVAFTTLANPAPTHCHSLP